jgi:glycosyltransferase involved in cell wall biosynthesis
LGIPDEARVILSVATIDRQIKRVDYLLRETASLDNSIYLLVAGHKSADTPELEREAEQLIPGRWKFVTWPHERVGSLYGGSDIFVLTSLREAFGRVIVEALLGGLPTITHNGPVFRWVTEGTSARTIDMASEGSLARELSEVLGKPAHEPVPEAAAVRFSWEHLIEDYVRMYSRIATTDN